MIAWLGKLDNREFTVRVPPFFRLTGGNLSHGVCGSKSMKSQVFCSSVMRRKFGYTPPKHGVVVPLDCDGGYPLAIGD